MDYGAKNLHYPIMTMPRAVRFSLVSIYEHQRNWTWRRGEVDHYNLWFAIKGQGTIAHSGRTWPFVPGTFFLFPPELSLFGSSSACPDVTNFTIHVEADRTAVRALERHVHGGEPVHMGHLLWSAHLCRHLSEVFFLHPKDGRDVLQSGLMLLLQSMERSRRAPVLDPVERGVIQLVERIRRNPAAAYTVAEMAHAVRLSPPHFTRRFKAVTGLSPVRFLIEERLGRAESYLLETDMNVEEIAARLGYRDVYFFSRQFRQFRGMPPSEVRKGRQHRPAFVPVRAASA